MTSGNLWNYYRDETNDAANENVGDYRVNNYRVNTEVLKSNRCHYNDAYILVRGDVTIVGNNRAEIAFKTCAPFIKCTTKIIGTTTDDAEDLNLVMTMYNLLKYSLECSDTTGSLWFYS